MNDKAKPKDQQRVIWAPGCEPPRPPEYPPNHEPKRVQWTDASIRVSPK